MGTFFIYTDFSCSCLLAVRAREFGFLNSSSICFDFSTIKMQAVLQLWKVSFFTQSPFSFLKFVEKDAITSSAYMAFMVNIVDQEDRHRLNRIAMCGLMSASTQVVPLCLF